MDIVLSDAFVRVDNTPRVSCMVALVLGDHRMTKDGNHRSNTSNKVNAGLFAHYSSR